MVSGGVFRPPRCILCYRCVRVCGEGMDVWALACRIAVSVSIIAPNQKILSTAKSAACVSTSVRSGAHFRRLSVQDASVGDETCGRSAPHSGRLKLRWACAARLGTEIPVTTATRAG